jgi:hypothetical protein
MFSSIKLFAAAILFEPLRGVQSFIVMNGTPEGTLHIEAQRN